jgi:hypothetical protein
MAICDTPLRLKPRGFFSLSRKDCIPFACRDELRVRLNTLRGRCHHRRLRGGSKFASILLSMLHTSRWAHRTSGLLERRECCPGPKRLAKHGNVFTASPSLANPYILQLFKVLYLSSHTGGQKWKETKGKGSN